MIFFCCNLVRPHWYSGNLTSGGNTNLGNLPFELYLMEAATGFSDNPQGIEHYIDICKQNNLLPVGCGTSTYNCDMNRYNGEPCLPLPEAWGCNLGTTLQDLKANTGWDNRVVAIQSATYRGTYIAVLLVKHPKDSSGHNDAGHPNENENLQAVCGKPAGMFIIQLYY